MINRRSFLAVSGAGALCGGLALGSARWTRGLLGSSGTRVSIGETFVPAEWLNAFARAARQGHSEADLVAWRQLPFKQTTLPSFDAGEMHLLALPAPGLEPFEPGLAHEISGASNDRLSELTQRRAGRLGGLASIAAFDPLAVREAERAVGRLGLVGLSLGANRGMRLSHRRLWPVYDFAQATATPIYLPAAYGAATADLPYRALRREGIIAGAAADSAGHAAQLIFGGVLDAFPRLTVILGRLGEAAPHWYGELVAAAAASDAGPSAPKREIEDYFRTNIYLTTADMTSPATFDFCQLFLGAGRLLRSREGSPIELMPSTVERSDRTRLTQVSLGELRRSA